MISIDTSTMQQLAQAASTANSAINQAMEILNRISAHNDWACKEKDAINDYTTTNKNRARQLHENAQSFFNAVKGVSVDFETAETGISNMFSSVESILAGVLQIAQNAVTNVVGGVQTGVTVVQTVMNQYLQGVSNGTIDPAPGGAVPIIGSIPTGGSTIMADYLPSALGDLNPLADFTVHNMTEALPVCMFRDIKMQ